MSSDRSNDDIQSELVEILGFEGDGLALVEELLRTGVREALMADMRGSGSRVSLLVFVSQQADCCSRALRNHRIIFMQDKGEGGRRRKIGESMSRI